MLNSADARIATCSAAEIFDDQASAELFAEYEVECANALLGKPRPQRDVYENLEAIGFAQCFSAREDGQLIGFAFLVMAVVPHFGLSYATVESLFVAQAARSGGPGLALIRAVEDYGRANGCRAIFLIAPVGSRLARLLFLSPDEYTHTNEVFCRTLA